MVEIEIDGKQIKVPEGTSIIEAADDAGIYIPRFCYHKKLSIAANCRMCLVEVEKVGKPLPACATPVTPGMKVLTKSPSALSAQRSVMEFLLINHPLDCPICDQGGECELQDLSMGFGNAYSEYDEPKRSVFSEDIGPLIETEMTRCIHCTRCVRFGEEIAALRELGVTYRGEHSEIGTYVKHFLKSELSGNIIDLCPVGALTNKPARYQGRSWEYHEHTSIAPHDCVGSNIYVHTRGRTLIPQRFVVRAVPRENEAVNETWLSDRDRYSCHALYHESRIYKPRMKKKQKWVEVEWERVLAEIADKMQAIVQQQGAEQMAGLVSPSATIEAQYLLQKILRALGCHNIDHRLREQDFTDQHEFPSYPGLGMPIADVEQMDAVLLVGSNIRHEQPLLNHRVRKAAQDGAKILTVGPREHIYTFPLTEEVVIAPQQLVTFLAEIAHALNASIAETHPLLQAVIPSESARAMAQHLAQAEKVQIIVGEHAMHHPQAGDIRALVAMIAQLSGGKIALLTDGANAAGAWLAGAVPHRGPAGADLTETGLDAKALLTSDPVRAYLLLNLEPEFDCAYPAAALQALTQAGMVVCMTAYVTETMEQYADFILPITPFTETAGTLVNCEGRWQSFAPAGVPHQSAKPAWKVLRVLANFLQLPGFDYKTVHEVRHEIKTMVEAMPLNHQLTSKIDNVVVEKAELMRVAPWPMYRVDGMVRRSQPLQECIDDVVKCVAVNAATADKYQLQVGELVTATQGSGQIHLPLAIDHRLADNTVLLYAGLDETAGFGQVEAPITIERRQ